GIGIVDDHDHREARVLHRHHAGEVGQVAARVAAGLAVLARGTGLAGDVVTEDRRLRRRAAGFGHRLHHAHDFVRDLGIQYLPGFVALALDEGRGDQLSAVAQGRVHHRDLQRRRRHAVTVGHGGLGRAAPARGHGEHAGGFAGEAAARLLAVAELADEVVEVLVLHPRRELGRADVGTLGDHPGDRLYAVVAVVADGVAPQLHVARVEVDAGVRGNDV